MHALTVPFLPRFRAASIAACLLCWLLGASLPGQVPDPGRTSSPAVLFRDEVRPFLDRYCSDCHSGDAAEGGLRLDQFRDQLEAGRHPDRWKQVARQLESASMPPADHAPQPAQDQRARVLDWIDRTFINVDCSDRPDPGRVTVRRLNRAEYNNTIRDLLGVDFQPAADFPSDDVGYGFDNIGDVLTISPLLMEKYFNAAERIATQLLSVEQLTQPHVVRQEGPELSATGSAYLNEYAYHQIPSQGTVFGDFDFPFAGDYILRTRVTADQAGDEPVKMALRLDGQTLQEIQVPRHRESAFFETRTSVAPGQHRFAVEFLNDFYDPDAPEERRDRNLGVHLLEIEGPFGVDRSAAREHLPDGYRRVVFCTPGIDGTATECATAILRKLAGRAYRRPVTPEELSGLVQLVHTALERGESFEAAIGVALQAVLVSPHFLFRVERDPRPDDAEQIHAVSDYELAARLSYFLWSTMPDETLFQLAARGTLRQPDVLEAQVRRMLRDRKSRALVDNFASQWLNLRNLDIATPNQIRFPSFNDDLRADMRRETELMFETVMRDDLSILTFLDADFTFVNERLAKHYGIEDIGGETFRRVSLAGTTRQGVLTHGSILTLTSDPTKTSPVKRGKWILDNLLGTPPPPPPAQVPAFEAAQQAKPDAPLREQLELHRSDALCASCHREMDPLGLALENFDAVGQWRDTDGGKPIDAEGTLPSGLSVRDARDLVGVLRARSADFREHFVRSMLTYALGRGLEYYDACAVREITQAVREDDDRFSRVLLAIVGSDPFLLRRGDGGSE